MKNAIVTASMLAYLSCVPSPETTLVNSPVVVEVQGQNSKVRIKENERVLLYPNEKVTDFIIRTLEQKMQEKPGTVSIFREIKLYHNNQRYKLVYHYSREEICDENAKPLYQGEFWIDFKRTSLNKEANYDWIQLSAKSPFYVPDEIKVTGRGNPNKGGDYQYYQHFPEAQHLYHALMEYIAQEIKTPATLSPRFQGGPINPREVKLLKAQKDFMNILPQYQPTFNIHPNAVICP